jgi:hypothetical protein
VSLSGTHIGSLILVGFIGSANTAPTVTDSSSQTYTQLKTIAQGANNSLYVYGCITAHAITTVTVSGPATIGGDVLEWVGAPATITGITDQSAAHGEATNTTIGSPDSITPTVPGSLCYAITGENNTVTAYNSGPGASMTSIRQISATRSWASAYYVNPPLSSIQPNWTWTTTRTITEIILNLKPGAVTSGGGDFFEFYDF